LADEAEPSGAAPHSANKRHRLAPAVEQGWIKYRRGEWRKSSGERGICEFRMKKKL